MTDEADKVLDDIRKRHGRMLNPFETYKVRITVPFYINVLVSARSPERALKQIQYDLMHEDRVYILENAEWKHLPGHSFGDCSGPKVVDRYDGETPALDDLLPPHKPMTAEQLEELMSGDD